MVEGKCEEMDGAALLQRKAAGSWSLGFLLLLIGSFKGDYEGSFKGLYKGTIGPIGC